jgi:hypothetical protein
MSIMSELDWEIEFRACEENMGPAEIADELKIPIDMVVGWFRSNGISVKINTEELSPYATVNS